MSDRLHIRTPSRLHFGLLGWGPEVVRQFGGIGLMIDSPGIELTVEPRRRMDRRGAAGGPSRADHRPASQSGCSNPESHLPPARVRVQSAPAEHVGLGVGTQLSLAVARAVLKLAGLHDPAACRARPAHRPRCPVGDRSPRISPRRT